MKLSNRLRYGAKGAFFVVGGDADNMLEAADLLDECERVIERYRRETPLGNQPHIIAHKADELLTKLRAEQENVDA